MAKKGMAEEIDMSSHRTSDTKEYQGNTWTFHIQEHVTEDPDGNRINTRLTVFDDGQLSEFSFALNDKDRIALIEALSKGVPAVRARALQINGDEIPELSKSHLREAAHGNKVMFTTRRAVIRRLVGR